MSDLASALYSVAIDLLRGVAIMCVVAGLGGIAIWGLTR